ncbi:putative oxidoreductase YtbE isoform X2 [Saccoglossus kowalevskii]
MTNPKKFTCLNTETQMPLIGYTAAVYQNENLIGNALKTLLPKYGLKREDLFIISKLGPKDHGSELAYKACLESLEKLQCDYLDLYLIHWPGKQKLKSEDPRHKQYRKESWFEFEKLFSEGLVKNIGVSNYSLKQLDEMLSYCKKLPAVLQVEYHPHLVQEDLLKWCTDHNVHLQAYRSLGISELLTDPLVTKMAKMYGKKESHVLLKWALQQNISVIPKSTNKDHLEENFNVWDFELTEDDILELKKLNRNARYCWDPSPVV